MRNYFFLLFAGVFCILTANAAPVDRQTAAAKARAFMAQRKGAAGVSLSLAMQGRHKMPGTNISASDTYYYVFNNGDGDGFVVMSGDDSAPGVLGYADSGSIDIDHLPDNMRAWLEGYAEEIAYARANAPAAAPDGSPRLSRMEIAPLLESQWNQLNPFNLKCKTTDGAKAVTGCVATALAQVMYYYRWPRNATTPIPAYLTFDELPATTFDWSHMRNYYSENEDGTDASADAVSQLLYYCGHAVKMSYGTSSSSASSAECATALNQYFGYENPVYVINRNSYNTADWEGVIYNELAHGRPVIYGGSNCNGSGHAFICDGYDGEGLFHINWGWSGNSDGYFRLQACNPSVQGTGGSNSSFGFSVKQSAVCGISPTEQTTAPEGDVPHVRVDEFRLANGVPTEYDYSGGSFSDVLLYYSFGVAVEGNYTMGFALYRDGEQLQTQTIGTYHITSAYPMYFSTDLTLWGIGANLSDGTYQIKCISKPANTSEWYLNEEGDNKYLEVTIADGKAVFVAKVVEPTIEVTHVEQLPDIGGRRRVRVSLTNVGEVDFKGPAYIKLNGTTKSIENAYLEPGKSDYVDFLFNQSAGTYQLDICTSSGSNVIYTDEAFVIGTVSVEQSPVELVSCEVKNLDTANHKMFGTLAQASVTLQNPSADNYEGDVLFRIYIKTNSNEYTWRDTSMKVKLAAGETKTFTVDNHYAILGNVVWFSVSAGGSTTNVGSFSECYTVCAAYVEWDALGNREAREASSAIAVSSTAAAASFEGLDVSSITIKPNANPNTLYYFDGLATVPSSLSGKNVVKERRASSNIQLCEGHDFYIPYTFDADAMVTYTRTPAASCNKKTGWQTICLPFSVKEVTSAGKKVDWNHSAADNNAFWLKQFDGVDGDLLVLSDVAQWMPNEPYIIGTPARMKDQPMVFSTTASRVLKTTSSTKTCGDYQMMGTQGDVMLKKVYLLDGNGSEFVLYRSGVLASGNACFFSSAREASSQLRISKDLLGDVNGDGDINVTDVVALVGYLMGNVGDTFIAENADVNSDSDISVGDVTDLVALVIGKQ